MEDYKFVYEHYRVPQLDVRRISRSKDTGLDIDYYSLRYDATYRDNYLIPTDKRLGKSPYVHGLEPATHGGKTVCKVLKWDEENEAWVQVAMGTSRCSIRDPFNYKIGRAIAKGRALKQMEEGAIER